MAITNRSASFGKLLSISEIIHDERNLLAMLLSEEGVLKKPGAHSSDGDIVQGAPLWLYQSCQHPYDTSQQD